MIAFLILVLSGVALLQFFVLYCRAMVIAARSLELSQQARDVSGIGARNVSGDEFGRLMQLLQLCPEPGNDGQSMAAVRTYYAVLGSLRTALGWMSRGFSTWLDGERGSCAYFAAVVLDRRIAHSRAMMAEQISAN
jgi:hypothetical protein